MNILIYGSGAIGSHLTYVLNNNENKIYLFVRNPSKNKLYKKKGINLTIKNNSKIIKKINLKKNINFISSLRELRNIKLKYIFFTFKLIGNYEIIFSRIKKIINKNTKLVLPCSTLPNWWLKRYSDRKIKFSFSEDQIIGMTMWISGMMNSNNVIIKHTQRGYPLKEIKSKSKKDCDALRKIFLKKTKSPKVKNIDSEIYLKVINSFAFNLIAIKYGENNFKLSKNKKAKIDIKSIMNEFDNILKEKKLKITQTINGRIKQTLSSKKHTMSMLFDLRKKKNIEIFNQWKSLKKIVSNKNLKRIKYSINTYNEVVKKIENEYNI